MEEARRSGGREGLINHISTSGRKWRIIAQPEEKELAASR
jgi:hypothetical protein